MEHTKIFNKSIFKMERNTWTVLLFIFLINSSLLSFSQSGDARNVLQLTPALMDSIGISEITFSSDDGGVISKITIEGMKIIYNEEYVEDDLSDEIVYEYRNYETLTGVYSPTERYVTSYEYKSENLILIKDESGRDEAYHYFDAIFALNVTPVKHSEILNEYYLNIIEGKKTDIYSFKVGSLTVIRFNSNVQQRKFKNLRFKMDNDSVIVFSEIVLLVNKLGYKYYLDARSVTIDFGLNHYIEGSIEDQTK